MPRRAADDLLDQLDRFAPELEELAWMLVRAVLVSEAERRGGVRTARPTRRPRAKRSDATALEMSAPPIEATPAPPAAVAPMPVPVRPRRGGWTRERVVGELAQWLIESKAIDASFLTRRGHAPLVAAARRIFGRFDAALNVASLHLAALYPDGVPKRTPATAM